ncbi:hypothetical protein SUGI_0131700 [Cryptomeria japonica]|nr:hypothetical protein SUGI_0131700 [Cryptomeria japonica]
MAKHSSEAINVRFLINSKTQRIIYAKSGKEFVDFLFSILSMPIGSVLKFSDRKVGSVSNLYDSIEKMPSEFMKTDKSQLLDPKFVTPYSNNSLKIEGGNYYVCSNSYTIPIHNISTNSEDICICGGRINRLVQLRQKATVTVNQSSGKINQTTGHSGYVKEMLTFIITDDLKIKPSSTITGITFLNQLNIKDLTDLEERTAIVDSTKVVGVCGKSERIKLNM